MPEFIHGLELSERFYNEAARPILEAHFPNVRHSAALIGWGSGVLGYDNPQSTDHHWGPRFLLFLSEQDRERYEQPISVAFSENLPYEFCGYPTNFGPPDEEGARLLQAIDAGPVNHMIHIETMRSLCEWYLGCNPYAEIKTAGWLAFSEHKLLAITSGKVFHDGLGKLEAVRTKFAYYPRDVWLYLLASQWKKIAQEEPFMARCGDVGDEIGSQIIATRVVHHLMQLCFLMERRYAPYSKWFGTAFARLDSAGQLGPILRQVLASGSWKEREQHLSRAYEIAAELHNSLRITRPLETKVSQFWNRPYLVIHADVFADEISKAIADEEVKAIGAKIGSVNQFVDSTDVLTDANLCNRLKVMWE